MFFITQILFSHPAALAERPSPNMLHFPVFISFTYEHNPGENCNYSAFKFYDILVLLLCAGIVVGIATGNGLDGRGSNPGGGRDFPPVQTGPGAHPASCTMGTGSFLGVKCGRDVLLTTHPLLVPRSWKSRAIPLPILWATPGL